MDKITKLSQAIRLGAQLHPQCFNSYRTIECIDGKATVVRTCAIGAAIEAMKLATGEYWDHEDVMSRFPSPHYSDIIDKNDAVRLSREKIASWLESEGY